MKKRKKKKVVRNLIKLIIGNVPVPIKNVISIFIFQKLKMKKKKK